VSFGGSSNFTIQGLIQLIAESRGLNEMTSQLNGLANTAAKAQSQMQRLGSTLQKTGRSLEHTGIRMSAAITASLVGLGFAAGKAFVDFDTAFTKIAALVGVPADELAVLRQQVLDLGPQVAQSPLDLANALYFVTSSGFAASEAMDVVVASAKAAATGMGTTALVADLVTTVLNAYGHENISAAQATDILTAAIREGKAEPEEMAAALSKSIANASLLGVSFDEVAASIATLSLAGIPAAEAGTALNQMFSNMIKPTDKAKETLDQYGLSMEQLRDLLRTGGPIAVIRLLSETFGDNEEAMASVFGNIRALRFVNSVLALSQDQVNKVFKATANSAGDLNDAFEVTQKSAGFKLKAAMSQLSEILIQLGAVLIPMVVLALQFLMPILTRLAHVFDALPDPIKAAIIIFAAFVAAIGPVLIYVGFLVQAIGVLISVFAEGGIFAAGGALGFLGPLVLGLVAVIALMALLGASSKTIFFGFAQAVRSVANVLSVFWKYIKEVNKDGDILNDWLSHLPKPIQAVAKLFGRWLNAIKKVSSGLFEMFQALAAGDLDKAFRKLRKTIAGVGDFLGAPFKAVGEFIRGIQTGFEPLDHVLRLLGQHWIDLGRIIQEVFQGDWHGAMVVGERMLKRFGLLFPALKTLVFTTLGLIAEWLVGAGKELIGGLLRGAESRLADLLSWVGRLATNVSSELQKAIDAVDWSTLWDTAVSDLQSAALGGVDLANITLSTIIDLAAQTPDIVSDFYGWMKKQLKVVDGQVVQIGTTVVQTNVQLKADDASQPQTFWQKLGEKLKQTSRLLHTIIFNIFKAVAQSIALEIGILIGLGISIFIGGFIVLFKALALLFTDPGRAWEMVKGFYVSVNNALLRVQGTLWTDFKKIASGAWDAFKEGIRIGTIGFDLSSFTDPVKAMFRDPSTQEAMKIVGREMVTLIGQGLDSLNSWFWNQVWIFIVNNTGGPVDGLASGHFFYNKGRDIVSGIWTGISSLGGWLYNQVVEFVKNYILHPWDVVTGSFSPSKVMADKGKDLVHGLAIGMIQNQSVAEKAATSLGKAVTDAVSTTTVDGLTGVYNQAAKIMGRAKGQLGGAILNGWEMLTNGFWRNVKSGAIVKGTRAEDGSFVNPGFYGNRPAIATAGSNVHAGGVVINVNGAGDPKTVATEVYRQLDAAFGRLELEVRR
jgi:TP901 family phage tail tape measure protein